LGRGMVKKTVASQKKKKGKKKRNLRRHGVKEDIDRICVKINAPYTPQNRGKKKKLKQEGKTEGGGRFLSRRFRGEYFKGSVSF